MYTRFLALFFVLISSTHVFADPLSESRLKELANQFIAAKQARQQPGTTVRQIEEFIDLFDDNFVDEHIKFNVTVTDKNELRKGMTNKLKDKVYFCNIRIDDTMFGRNVAFVKYTEHAKVRPSHLNKDIEYTSTNLLSIEYNEQGKITHLRRHHGL